MDPLTATILALVIIIGLGFLWKFLQDKHKKLVDGAVEDGLDFIQDNNVNTEQVLTETTEYVVTAATPVINAYVEPEKTEPPKTKRTPKSSASPEATKPKRAATRSKTTAKK